MSQELEILVPDFGEVNDSEWPRVERETIDHYKDLLKTFPAGPINGSVEIRNIGKGADWSVIVLIVAGLFFTIPEAHKKLRESLEEWRRIFKELKAVLSWLVGEKHALYPDQYLFLVALFTVTARIEPETLTFLGLTPLPENHPDLSDKCPLLFSFAHDSVIHQVAVGRDGQVLWENQFSIPTNGPNNAFNSVAGKTGPG